jgi:uncharacterized membrane protein YhhN
VLPFFVAMAALVAALLWVIRRRRGGLEWLFKPAAAATFLAAAVYAGALETAFGQVLFAGLVLSALGDVLLIPESRAAFLAGLGSFLLGHVAYAIAFGLRGVAPLATGVAAAAVVVVAFPILRWLWPHVPDKMRPPVAGYILAISAMVALAIGTFAAHGNAALVVGAIGFYLSDLAVARDRFVAKGFVNRAWGLPLYFFAQLTLATAV